MVAQAKDSRKSEMSILHCLGDEELFLHESKTLGAVYRLNQDLINRFALANYIRVKPEYLKDICDNPHFSPSLGFLKALLVEGKKIFHLSLTIEQRKEAPYALRLIDEFEMDSLMYLRRFLADLQSSMPKAHCLDKEIPSLKKTQFKIKYLEDEMDVMELIKRLPLKDIFNELKGIDQIYQKCSVAAKQEFKKRYPHLHAQQQRAKAQKKTPPPAPKKETKKEELPKKSTPAKE